MGWHPLPSTPCLSRADGPSHEHPTLGRGPALKPCNSFLHERVAGRDDDPFHGSNGPLHVTDLRSPCSFARYFVEAAAAGHPFNHYFNGARQEGVGHFQVTQRDGERWGARSEGPEPLRRQVPLPGQAGVRWQQGR
ncbi:GMC family oxidoreductase [Pseudomonas sp. BN102]|nr:GMC family oxidoreductase [Pseudomonas sp. BN102]